jgi:phage head maturation protease
VQQKLDKPYAVKAAIHGASIKDVDMGKRVVTGLYNAYNYIDSDGDVLLMGAAAKSIGDRGPKSNAVAKIKHAVQHDLNRLPGRIEVLEEKTVEINGRSVAGLYFETRMANTTLGNDTLIGYQEGIYDNHSIGFRYQQIEMIEKGTDAWARALAGVINPEAAEERIWIVKEIRLFEGSTVAFGANALTPALGIKSDNKDIHRLRLQEKVSRVNAMLSGGQMSDEGMKMMELELAQLSQMIMELDFEPSMKRTIEADSRANDIPNEAQRKKDLFIKLLTK